MPKDTPPTTSAASWAPNGEFLIDGLGVDGRDCTQNEAGWAEPGTMSALWGRKPRSPPQQQQQSQRERRRQQRVAGPSSPPLLVRNLSSSTTSDARRVSRSTDLASCSTCISNAAAAAASAESPRLCLDASCSSPPLPASALNPPPSARPSPSSPHPSSPSASYSLKSGQCRTCAISVSEGSSRASTECSHCLNCAPPRPSTFFAHRSISRGMKRMLGSMSSGSDAEQDYKEDEEYGGTLAAISEEPGAQENPTIGGTTITVVDIVRGRTCRPISLSEWSSLLTFSAQQADAPFPPSSGPADFSSCTAVRRAPCHNLSTSQCPR